MMDLQFYHYFLDIKTICLMFKYLIILLVKLFACTFDLLLSLLQKEMIFTKWNFLDEVYIFRDSLMP